MPQIDFKKELEIASKSMIMIHDPKLLIKLIVRMIVRKLQIKHAAMILYESDKDAYVLSISRGETGVKLPAGYTRFNRESPLIKLFTRKEYKHLTYNRNAIVSEDINRLIWHETVIKNGNGNGHEIKDLLHKVNEQMEELGSIACVPAYYRHTLMVVLLLGEKYDETKFSQEELDFFAALASDAAMAIRNAQLFTHLKTQSERNRKLFLQTINVLGSTIEAKDSYTHGHTERVTQYSLAIARQMVANRSERLKKSFFESLYIAALLHDIGKIAIPEVILNKPGRLTEEEYDIIKTHTVKGAEIITPLAFPQECYNGILYHHERFDGKGYPEGLEGENIPISASIIAVADAYDAMTSDRPYRKGLDKTAAIKEVEKNIGIQFCPLPAKAMLELYERGEV